MTSSSPPIYRPTPRRPFQHRSVPQQPPIPLLSPTYNEDTPSRTHSILNLTSSTLLGIYSSTGYSDDRDEPSTPWGTGAQTPTSLERPSIFRRKSLPPPASNTASNNAFSLALRSVTLFGLGMLYGLLVRHLHDERQLAPFQVEGIIKPRNDWRYLVFWGVAGVALGSLLPWIDTLWEEHFETSSTVNVNTEGTSDTKDDALDSTGMFGADWTPVVRSVGAFVGIAFAIRKLSWTSTLQASLTLALVNPVLWYIIDRSKTGFILSASVGATGTALLLASNPNMMPSPASTSKNSTIPHHSLIDSFGGYVSRESLEGGIWILSVLFCSCVCFGNIGRRLALSIGGRERLVERRALDNGSKK